MTNPYPLLATYLYLQVLACPNAIVKDYQWIPCKLPPSSILSTSKLETRWQDTSYGEAKHAVSACFHFPQVGPFPTMTTISTFRQHYISQYALWHTSSILKNVTTISHNLTYYITVIIILKIQRW